MKNKILFLAAVFMAGATANALEVRSFSLTEIGQFKYDARFEEGKTDAQLAVDYMIDVMGVNHIVLTPEANMTSHTASNIIPKTPSRERNDEFTRYLRLIDYIHEKGATVGIRPITLLSSSQGGYWHGNIQPENPAKWFGSLLVYLQQYAVIAEEANLEWPGSVTEFTVGAELYSMTVGLEDQWPEHPFGFPREWTGIVREMRSIVGSQVRIMYDINYTDATENSDGTGPSGGELLRWYDRLVRFRPQPGEPTEAWDNLKEFWLSLDAIGIDIYRSLMPRNEQTPVGYDKLVDRLSQTVEQFASDIEFKLRRINRAVGEDRKIVIKEIGYKSCRRCFIDPFTYDDPRVEVNLEHQNAAFQSVFNGFVLPGYDWLLGISFWDVSVDPSRSGSNDAGFSPVRKPVAKIIKEGWK